MLAPGPSRLGASRPAPQGDGTPLQPRGLQVAAEPLGLLLGLVRHLLVVVDVQPISRGLELLGRALGLRLGLVRVFAIILRPVAQRLDPGFDVGFHQLLLGGGIRRAGPDHGKGGLGLLDLLVEQIDDRLDLRLGCRGLEPETVLRLPSARASAPAESGRNSRIPLSTPLAISPSGLWVPPGRAPVAPAAGAASACAVTPGVPAPGGPTDPAESSARALVRVFLTSANSR